MIGLTSIVWAHESRPLYVEITEREPERFAVQWKIPTSIPQVNTPELILPSTCRPQGEDSTVRQADAVVRQRQVQCPGGLAGGDVAIRFPVLNPSVSSLFRLQRLSGETVTKLLIPGEQTWRVPARATRLGVARDYTVLGIRHILEGTDHLLFLGCLLLIAGSSRRLLVTITGFTLAHSLTLILSALNVVRVPVPPVEAAIALSVVFLATEIAGNSRNTLTYRYPIAVSASFGLLHGFGFAAVLKDIGLPQTDIPTSLLFFNLGVEIGQLLFVGGLIVAAKGFLSVIRGAGGQLARLERPAAYVIGSVASFWLVQRVYAFWG